MYNNKIELYHNGKNWVLNITTQTGDIGGVDINITDNEAMELQAQDVNIYNP